MKDRAKAFAKLVRNVLYDAWRYLRFSSLCAPSHARERLAAQIKMDAHRLEKGLALPEMRTGFGADVLARLTRDVRLLEATYGEDAVTAMARMDLREYCERHRTVGAPNHSIEAFLAADAESMAAAATLQLDSDAVREAARVDFEAFAWSRHSLRQFSENRIDPGEIEAAVHAAQRTPSVCNRQSAKAYHIATPDLRRDLLQVQGGNRGFGETIPELLVVTSQLDAFVSPAERYQCWIDGGLFAMSLVYALHARGLGTCMLNWSVDPSRDRRARHLMRLQDRENIIVFIAVGHYPKRFEVAASHRLRPADLLVRL